jgi:hypothetical protein
MLEATSKYPTDEELRPKFQLLACRTFGDPLAKELSFRDTLLLLLLTLALLTKLITRQLILCANFLDHTDLCVFSDWCSDDEVIHFCCYFNCVLRSRCILLRHVLFSVY